jgi:hypothetical protein
MMSVLLRQRRRFAAGVALLAACLGCSVEPSRAGAVLDASPRDAGWAHSLPPLAGGTLLLTSDGSYAVAADPDVDRLFIVGIGARTPGCSGCDAAPRLLGTVDLGSGEEPGRLAEDRHGRVHVVLRRGGALATVDLGSRELLARRPVCAAPRGVVYDVAEDLLHVACASGELVSLSPLDGRVRRTIPLDIDLRDVVVTPSGLVVSRFKSAELLRLAPDGTLLGRVVPSAIERGPQDLTSLRNDPFEPAVAWRAVAGSSGAVHLLHQYGLARPIDLREVGGSAFAPPYAANPGSPCGGVVLQTVSTLGPEGDLDMGLPLPVVSLTVDAAISRDGDFIAVAQAGARAGARDDAVTLYRTSALPSLGRTPVRCAENQGRVIVAGQPVAVAFHPTGVPAALADADWLVVQTRSPAALAFYRGFTSARASVALEGGEPSAGHDLFHLDAGGGIACAQCHPEGGEDGRVWHFEPIGARRTQPLHVRLEQTAPFHWDGDLPTLEALLDETFVRRMGASAPSAEVVSAAKQWLFSLEPPPAPRRSDEPAVLRGKALFESPAVGCTECHAGGAVAHAENVDVGVASPHAFQVPALWGVAYRAPFLHDGCAQALGERFEPPCEGDDRHGKTSHLATSEIDDLVAYLSSL